MAQYSSQIQNQFLSLARRKHLRLEIVLETGVVLRGRLEAYDQFSISLSFRGKLEVVYKAAIIYITALLPFRTSGHKFKQRAKNRSGSFTSIEPTSSPYDNRQKNSPESFSDFSDDDDFQDPPPPKKIPPRR